MKRGRKAHSTPRMSCKNISERMQSAGCGEFDLRVYVHQLGKTLATLAGRCPGNNSGYAVWPSGALPEMQRAKLDYARRCSVMLTTPTTNFGIQVRMARAGLAWSQDDLASRARVSARTIKNVEADRRKPRQRKGDKIAGALTAGGAELEGGCRVRIRGDARFSFVGGRRTSSECRP